MLDILNWFLAFVKTFFQWIFSIKSSDGYSLGGTVVGIVIVGIVVAATVGVVAVVTSVMRAHRRD